jgi:hypothetical protein
MFENIVYDMGYRVNNDGEVISMKNYKRKLNLNQEGYLKFTYRSKNGNCICCLVHRLMAYQKYGDKIYEDGIVVRHLNGIKTDNRVQNLEWVSQSQNIIHGLKTGLIPSGEKSHRCKLKKTDIEYIRKNYKYKSKEFGSKKLAQMFGVCYGTILRIVKNKLWKYENYAC